MTSRSSKTSRASALVTGALAVALLAGCSSTQAGPAVDRSSSPEATRTTAAAAPAQTEAQACAIVEDRVKAFFAGQATPTTDQERVASVRAFSDQVDDLLPDLTNERVHGAISSFRDSAEAFADHLEKRDVDQATAVSEFQSATEQASKVCG